MQADPLVCAIMLTRDRPEMAARAVRCFREQTYKNRVLQIWSTSGFPDPERDRPANEFFTEDVPDYSIGELRNRANDWHNAFDAAILIHWDDDDWSHPNRIAEQVALLQSSCAECVGYHSMYFWEGAQVAAYLYSGEPPYAIGASLCYWRSAWEKRPFLDVPIGEDSKFLDGTSADGKTRIAEPLRVASVSANCGCYPLALAHSSGHHFQDRWAAVCGHALGSDPLPRMIARIHAGSLSYKAGYRNRLEAEPWSRVTVPSVIDYCREVMEL